MVESRDFGILRYKALEENAEVVDNGIDRQRQALISESGESGLQRFSASIVVAGMLDVADIGGGGVDIDDAGDVTADVDTNLIYTISNSTSTPLKLANPPVSISSQVGVTAIVTSQPATTIAPGAQTSFTVSVTPIGAGSFSFVISITLLSGTVTAIPVSGVAFAAPDITNTTLVDGEEEVAYTDFVDVTGGKTPLEFTVTAGVLPNGITLNSVTGELSGVPLESGIFVFTVQVEDDLGVTDSQVYTLTLEAAGGPWLGWTEDYYAADPGNIDSLFQDQAKTTPVTADGQPVVAIEIYPNDQSTLFDTASSALDVGWNYGDGASTNNINGLPVFWFNGTQGTGNLINGAKQIQQYATTTLTFTFHMVLKRLAGAADNTAITGPVSSGGGNGIGTRYQSDGTPRFECSGFINGFLSQSITWNDDDPHVLTMRLTAETGDIIFYKDGVSIGTLDSNAWTDTELVNVLGASNFAVGVWLFYDGADADYTQHITDIMTYFGI